MSLKKEVTEILKRSTYSSDYFGEPVEAFEWAAMHALHGYADAGPEARIIAGLIMELHQMQNKIVDLSESSHINDQAYHSVNRMLEEVGKDIDKLKNRLEEVPTGHLPKDQQDDVIGGAIEDLEATLRKFHPDYIPEPDE